MYDILGPRHISSELLSAYSAHEAELGASLRKAFQSVLKFPSIGVRRLASALTSNYLSSPSLDQKLFDEKKRIIMLRKIIVLALVASTAFADKPSESLKSKTESDKTTHKGTF